MSSDNNNGNGTITLYESDVTNFINNSSNSNHFKNRIMSYLKKEYNYVLLKGLNSKQRHLIYKQMIHPLKFEKINVNENENVTIRIYVNEDQEKETEEESEDQDDESYVPTEGSEETEESVGSEDEELEYNNEKINREYLQLILNIQNKTINKLEKIELNTNKIIRRTNLLMTIVVVGWCILFTYDPVKLVITN